MARQAQGRLSRLPQGPLQDGAIRRCGRADEGAVVGGREGFAVTVKEADSGGAATGWS